MLTSESPGGALYFYKLPLHNLHLSKKYNFHLCI